MVVESSKNLPNQSMHYGVKNVVGVLDNVPDTINVPKLYSKLNTQKVSEPESKDVFIKPLNLPKENTYSFPPILKILGGAIGITSLALWHKPIWKGLKTFIRNLPK